MQSSCFWRCLPSKWGNSFIDNACFRVLVQLRYRQQVMYAGPCPMLGCSSTLDVSGDHTLCCKVGAMPRFVTTVLLNIALECGKPMSGVTLETRALLPGSEDRPGDVVLSPWRGQAHALDITAPHVITTQTPHSPLVRRLSCHGGAHCS